MLCEEFQAQMMGSLDANRQGLVTSPGVPGKASVVRVRYTRAAASELHPASAIRR